MRILIAAVLCLAVAGCHRAGLREQLVGKWTATGSNGQAVTMQLFPTGDFATGAGGGTWTLLDGSHLKLDSKTTTTVASVNLSPDGQSLAVQDAANKTVTFHRVTESG